MIGHYVKRNNEAYIMKDRKLPRLNISYERRCSLEGESSQFFEGKQLWYSQRLSKISGVTTRKDFLQAMQIYSEGYLYHYIYAFKNENNEFLYIGETHDFDQRMRSHRSIKHWWPEVKKIMIEKVVNTRVAKRREASLIKKINPRHNKTESRRQISQEDIPEILHEKIDLEYST